jgi:hypothetical protein
LLSRFHGCIPADAFENARRGAAVGAARVSIITLFRSLEDAIAALRFRETDVRTSVVGNGISIIAFFSKFSRSVSADCLTKASARIVTEPRSAAVPEAVVANLPEFPESVAAECARGIVRTDGERGIERKGERAFVPRCALPAHKGDHDCVRALSQENAAATHRGILLNAADGIGDHAIDRDPAAVSRHIRVAIESRAGNSNRSEPLCAVMSRVTGQLLRGSIEWSWEGECPSVLRHSREILAGKPEIGIIARIFRSDDERIIHAVTPPGEVVGESEEAIAAAGVYHGTHINRAPLCARRISARHGRVAFFSQFFNAVPARCDETAALRIAEPRRAGVGGRNGSVAVLAWFDRSIAACLLDAALQCGIANESRSATILFSCAIRARAGFTQIADAVTVAGACRGAETCSAALARVAAHVARAIRACFPAVHLTVAAENIDARGAGGIAGFSSRAPRAPIAHFYPIHDAIAAAWRHFDETGGAAAISVECGAGVGAIAIHGAS